MDAISGCKQLTYQIEHVQPVVQLLLKSSFTGRPRIAPPHNEYVAKYDTCVSASRKPYTFRRRFNDSVLVANTYKSLRSRSLTTPPNR